MSAILKNNDWDVLEQDYFTTNSPLVGRSKECCKRRSEGEVEALCFVMLFCSGVLLTAKKGVMMFRISTR